MRSRPTLMGMRSTGQVPRGDAGKSPLIPPGARPALRPPSSTPAALAVLASLAIAAAFQLLYVPDESPVVLPVVFILTILVFLASAHDQDRNLLILGWALRLLAGLVFFRFLTIAGPSTDWTWYDERGWGLALQIRAGEYFPSPVLAGGGTNVDVLVGYVYALTGRSMSTMIAVEAFLGLCASRLYLGACRLATATVPTPIRYGLLFFPSFVFWTSIIGKDPMVNLGIALAVFGVTGIVGRTGAFLRSVLCAAAGVGVCLLIRPHIALILVPAAVAAFLMTSVRGGRVRRGTAFLALLLGLAAMSGTLMVAGRFLKVETDRPESVFEVAGRVKSGPQGNPGGSATRLGGYDTFSGFVGGLPVAVGTLLFRPFPWEVRNAAMLLAALDTVLLWALCIWLFRLLVRLRWPRLLWRNPVLLFFVLAAIGLLLLFSNATANLGTMVRQRVQVIPAILLVAAVLAAPRRREGRSS